MNKTINKLLKEIEEYGVVILEEKREYVKRQLERAYIKGNIKGLNDAKKIYKK